MRLQKALNRTVGEKTYWKFRVADVPAELVARLGWIDGDALLAEVRGDALVLRREEKPQMRRRTR